MYLLYFDLSAFCVGKSSGLHADPEDCRAYYDCNKDTTRHRTGLSTGLMFDPKSKTFLHSWEMECVVKRGKSCERGTVKKPGTVLCSLFLLYFLGVDPTQNLQG